MGQGFSLTSNSTRVAQLERDLESEKGKCSKNDVVISGLQREVQGLKKQNEELDEVAETNKQLESENQELEKQIETLTATADASNTNRTKLEACSIRAQELKNANLALRRKLEASNEKAASQRDAPDPSPKIAALRDRVRSLETMVKTQRSDLLRITRFSMHNFTPATYKRTWVVLNPKRMRRRIEGELRLLGGPRAPQVSYRAVFIFRDNVLTIASKPAGVRRVMDAGAIWNELLTIAGKTPQRVTPKPVDPKPPPPAPKTKEMNSPIKLKPKPSTQRNVDVKPTPKPVPSFLRAVPRPWRTKDGSSEKPVGKTIVVRRAYRRDVNNPTAKIAGPFLRTNTSPDESPKTRRRGMPGKGRRRRRMARRQESSDDSPDKRKKPGVRRARRQESADDSPDKRTRLRLLRRARRQESPDNLPDKRKRPARRGRRREAPEDSPNKGKRQGFRRFFGRR